jgi:hypothetical protein
MELPPKFSGLMQYQGRADVARERQSKLRVTVQNTISAYDIRAARPPS